MATVTTTATGAPMNELLMSLPPGLILVLGGLLVPLLPLNLRRVWMLALPALGLAQIWMLPETASLTWEVANFQLEWMRVDGLSRIFGTVFHLAAMLGVIYSLHLGDSFKNRIEQTAALMYAGCAIGAAFSGDLLSLFVWWEGTAVTSVFLIWQRLIDPWHRPGEAAERTAAETAELRARVRKVGRDYLVIQVLSGMLLLCGAAFIHHGTGSIEFNQIGLPGTDAFDRTQFSIGTMDWAAVAGPWLLLAAFGIKAAFPFLHGWLRDAYPEGTPTSTVWLSAFTTKLAIYALARGFAGNEVLIPVGAAMTAFPVFYAVIVNDLRRVLSYSLNNQLGFMIVGIGIGTELAINGAAAHAFAHIIYKGLLFMSMGAVLHRVGTTKATHLGGLYKRMPLTTFFCVIGGMAISAFPLFSGFISKSMVLTAAAEGHHTAAFLVLLFASAGVLDHSGIKVPYFAFFHKDQGVGRKLDVKEAPANMLVAMGIAAVLCVALGIWYQPLYSILPFAEVAAEYHPYDLTHVVTQLQLLMCSIGAFVFLNKVGWYPHEERGENMDIDWIWRRGVPRAWSWSLRVAGDTKAMLGGDAEGTRVGFLRHLQRAFRPPGMWGEPWPTGSAAMFAALLLGVMLVFSLF